MVTPEAQAERLRCTNLVNALADHWMQLAAKTRCEGTFISRSIWPPFKKISFVRPGWERQAAHLEDAAGALRFVAKAINDGLSVK